MTMVRSFTVEFSHDVDAVNALAEIAMALEDHGIFPRFQVTPNRSETQVSRPCTTDLSDSHTL